MIWCIIICLLSYGYFDDSIPLLLEKFVGFRYPCKRITVRDERGGIYLAFLNELKNLFAVTAVHTSSLEGEVLTVHQRQRQHLWFIVESYYRYNGVWSGTSPCQLERLLASCNLYHSVGSTVVTVLNDEVGAFLRCGQQDIGIVLFDEGASFF